MRDYFDNNGQSLDRPPLWLSIAGDEIIGGVVSDERMNADKARLVEKARRFGELYPNFFDDLTRVDVDVVAKCKAVHDQIDREWFTSE